MKQALFALLLALQAMDVATTLYGIQLGAHEDERTFAARVFKWAGSKNWAWALVVMKVAFALLIAWLYNSVHVGVFVLLCAMFAWVCWHNYTVIKGLK